MRELTAIEDHIKRLHEETENIEVFVASAYSHINGESIPCLGIRDKYNKGIIIDGTPWLIAGTAFHSTSNNEIRYLSMFKCLRMENIYINLTAQSIINGCCVQVDLGTRKIVDIESDYENQRIFCELDVM